MRPGWLLLWKDRIWKGSGETHDPPAWRCPAKRWVRSGTPHMMTIVMHLLSLLRVGHTAVFISSLVRFRSNVTPFRHSGVNYVCVCLQACQYWRTILSSSFFPSISVPHILLFLFHFIISFMPGFVSNPDDHIKIISLRLVTPDAMQEADKTTHWCNTSYSNADDIVWERRG